MKPLAQIIETVTKQPVIVSQSADGKMVVKEGDKLVRISYWFDGDKALASDAELTTLILQVIRINCQWVINVFNNKNLASHCKKYNAWLAASQELLFVRPDIKENLRVAKKLPEFPTKNEFPTWLAKELLPLYDYIINKYSQYDYKLVRNIIVSLVQSFYPDHEKIQELNEDSLEKAFIRAAAK